MPELTITVVLVAIGYAYLIREIFKWKYHYDMKKKKVVL